MSFSMSLFADIANTLVIVDKRDCVIWSDCRDGVVKNSA
jgi:hypothetical protein